LRIKSSQVLGEILANSISEMAIRKAREHVPGRDNLTWGKYLQAAVTKRSLNELD